MIEKLKRHQFLFEELVKRDFKKKYKRTVLGMAWSVLSPLMTLLVMRLVFTQFFGRGMEHYTTYLFCGNLIFSCFNESTSQGMTSLMGNASIFTKVNVPKYLFLLSKNVQTLINFALTLAVFFVFCLLDQITFTWKFILLLYPVLCLVLFNIGVGMSGPVPGAVQHWRGHDPVGTVCLFPGCAVSVDHLHPAFDVYVRHLLYRGHLLPSDAEDVLPQSGVCVHFLLPQNRHLWHHSHPVAPWIDAAVCGVGPGNWLFDL